MTISSTQEALTSYGGGQKSRTRAGSEPVAGELKASPDDLARKIRALLDSQRIAVAKEAAARGAELFPEHPWLGQANKVLNPTQVTVTPAPNRRLDRRKEYDWLRQNRAEYQDRWVVLLEGKLLSCADSFEDAVGQVRARDLKARPLVHHVE